MWLSKRDILILRCLVRKFISSRNPISSKFLASRLPFSSSGIRKELQRLEKFGFIEKTNASSGRIPTNRGLRFYLREFLGQDRKADTSINFPQSDDLDFQSVSDNFLTDLTAATNQVGFIFLNSIFELKFKMIKLVKVAPYRVMTVLQSLNDCTFSKIFVTHGNYSEADLRIWQDILNREFKYKSLKGSFKIIRNRLYKEKAKFLKIYRELYYLLGNEDLMAAELFFKGAQHILDSSLVDPGQVRKLLEIIEEKERFSKFLNEISRGAHKNPMIVFGAETVFSDLDDFVFVFSDFYNETIPIGNIGVIGSKYMPNPQSISKIGLFSSHISKILSRSAMEV